MDTGLNPRKRGQRSWTDAQRQAARARALYDRPWAHSTGPRTPFGKCTSSRNSYKHGRYTHEKKILRWYVRLAAMRVKQIRHFIAHENDKRRNELLNKYGCAPRPRPYTMAFYPYFKVNPLDNKNKPPKKQTVFEYLTSLSQEGAEA